MSQGQQLLDRLDRHAPLDGHLDQPVRVHHLACGRRRRDGFELRDRVGDRRFEGQRLAVEHVGSFGQFDLLRGAGGIHSEAP